MKMALSRWAAVFSRKRKRDDEGDGVGDACEAKDDYMIHNGALLLRKQISSGQGKGSSSVSLRIFSIRELEQATNHYDEQLRISPIREPKRATDRYGERLVMGRNLRSCEYKGTLEDGRVVTIKFPRGLPPSEPTIDFFLNQVAVKQIVHHKNVIKLHGCCLETRVPTLVYEFIPNGKLFHQIHGKGGGSIIPRFNIPWSKLVRIAAEISHALSYMHLALSKPIVHMDVKTTSIYLDESFNAKLTNFGYSVSISPGEDFISQAVVGTLGYTDPEYQVTRKVTEKCDVYSFGVTLVELLTGKNPLPMEKRGNNLVSEFVRCLRQADWVPDTVHPRVLREASTEEIQAFAGIALRCVASRGEERPTMREVAIELRRIHLASKQRQI